MEKRSNLWVHLYPSLKKIVREIKIAILIILASVSITSGAITEFQQQTITGKVTDVQGVPLTGVNVVVKGTMIGATSDVSGNFLISVPDMNGILVFSFIGYTPLEVPINNQRTLNVRLTEELQALSEVVVTALGIKRESKTLGYATAVVNQVQLTENRSPNTLGTLQGKVSGVNITQFGTGPVGSTRIRIRGNSAFQGANLPLLVVNGVPIDNTRFSENQHTDTSHYPFGSHRQHAIQ